MDFLASCSLEESQQYSGKLVVPAEDGGKPGKVMLNIVCDNGGRDLLKSIGGNVKCVTYRGDMIGFDEESFEDIPQGVFHEVCFSDFSVEDTPAYTGVTTLVRLPEGFCDMRTLYKICNSRPDVRVIGGNLLGVDGVRIGRFDGGKDKLAPVFNGVYDSFIEVGLSELGDLTELVKKAKKKMKDTTKEPKPKAKKEKSQDTTPKRKVNKISTSFSCLFSESDVEEF